MKVSLAPEAEHELTEGARFYAREGSAKLAHEFIEEFERAAALLAEFPKLGAAWRGRIRRFPLKKALPPLTCLVVNQGSGLPGSGLKTVEDLPRDREDVYSKNWYAMYPPQIADFEEASA